VDPLALQGSWLPLAEKFSAHKDWDLTLHWYSIVNRYALDGDRGVDQTFMTLAKLAAVQMGDDGEHLETFFLDCLRAENMARFRTDMRWDTAKRPFGPIDDDGKRGIDASMDSLFQVAANYFHELESRRLLQLARINNPRVERPQPVPGENRSVVTADERRASLNSYKRLVRETNGKSVTDKMIAEAANPNWHDRTPVVRWKANDPRSTWADDQKIRRVLEEKPHLKQR